MRIGIYDQRTGTANAGGTETMIREIARELQCNHQIVLYTGQGDLLNEVSELEIDIVQIPWLSKHHPLTRFTSTISPAKSAEIGSLSMYLAGRATGLFSRIEEEVDVLWLHYYLDNLLVSRTVDIPTVFHVPGIKQQSFRWKTMFDYARPQLYVANSQSTRDRIEQWYDIEVDNVVYPGVRASQFLEGTDRSEIGTVTILYVGRLDSGKGLLNLVSAVATLDRDNLMLRIVGDGQLKSDLEEEADRLGIESQIELVGSVPHEQIHTEYEQADIFCLPSYHESHAIVNIEAMLSGVPVVSTNIDAIQEYIEDRKTGFIVEPGDVNALSNTFRRLVDDPELRQKVGQSGREVAKRYTVEASVDRIENIFKQVIASPSGKNCPTENTHD